MYKSLEEIALIISGKDYKSNPPGSNIPIYGTGGIMGYTSVPLNNGPSVLTGRKGTINRPIYVDGDFWNVDTIFCVKAKEGVDTKWLFYNFVNTDLSILNEATGVPSVNSKALYNLKFKWFELPEQRQIAHILSTADAVIDKTQAAIAKYKAIKQGMLHDLLTFGIERTDRKEKRINKSKYKPIKHFAKVRRGASPRPIDNPAYFGGQVGWVRISDVTSANKYLKKTTQYVSPLGESLSVRVDKGDLVMSICATIGRPVIIDMPACIHDGFVQLYDLKGIDIHFLYYTLQFSEKALERKGQPGTQVNLNSTIVEEFIVYYPDITEQKKIGKMLTAIDDQLNNEIGYLQKLQQLKSGLMGDLLSGRKKVKVKEGLKEKV